MNNRVSANPNLTLPSQHAHSTPLRTPQATSAKLWTPDSDTDTFEKEAPTLWQPSGVPVNANTLGKKLDDVAEQTSIKADKAKAKSRSAWAFVKEAFAHACGVAMSVCAIAVGKVQSFFGLRNPSQQPAA